MERKPEVHFRGHFINVRVLKIQAFCSQNTAFPLFNPKNIRSNLILKKAARGGTEKNQG
jgi:hypothetical protein